MAVLVRIRQKESLRRLRVENERLAKKLAQDEVMFDVQKKLYGFPRLGNDNTEKADGT